jgi:hypothetical protein
MGAEATCKAEYNGRVSDGTALLETDHLLFRGDYRVKVLFRDIVSLSADKGMLIVVTPDGELHLGIGACASRWKQKIENPPSLLDKLGVKTGIKVDAWTLRDSAVLQQIGALTPTGKVDLLFIGAEDLEELNCLARAVKRIQSNGGIWVVYPKGQKRIREVDVISAGRAAGLKDVKVASFSPTHTALKFVIPVEARKAAVTRP